MKRKLLITAEQIAKKIQEIASQLNQEYSGQEVVLVVVLKGAFVFVADLIRHLDFPCILEFVRASSYGARGKERGELTTKGIDTLELKGKNVLLIDDILDSGETLHHLYKTLASHSPLQIQTLVFLRKKHSLSQAHLPNYVCFDIEDQFVIGYGLDYKEQYRQLKEIYVLE